MPYTYLWYPENVRPSPNSVVIIRTWDNRNVPDATYTITGRSVNISVPEKDRYSLSIRTGPDSTTEIVDIPSAISQTSLAERIQNLESSTNKNVLFTVRWSTVNLAWEYRTLDEAKAAGLIEEQTVIFIGNPGGSPAVWIRPGDIWTQE